MKSSGRAAGCFFTWAPAATTRPEASRWGGCPRRGLVGGPRRPRSGSGDRSGPARTTSRILSTSRPCGRLCRLRGQGVAAAATGASEGHPGQGSASHRPRGLHCCPRGIRHLTPSGRPGDEAPDAADLVRLSVELAEKPSQGLPERGRAVEDVLGEVPILVAHGDPGPSRVAVDPTIVVDQGEDQLHDGTVGHGAAHGRVRRVVEVAGQDRAAGLVPGAGESLGLGVDRVGQQWSLPEGLLRRSGTVRTLGPVDPVARERPETGAQHRRHGLAPGADVLTSCLPCHPHPLTRSFTALPSTASALLSRDAGRGAVGRREATRGSLLTRFSARLDRQSMVEDLVGIPSALRFLEFLVVPAVVQLGPWDA